MWTERRTRIYSVLRLDQRHTKSDQGTAAYHDGGLRSYAGDVGGLKVEGKVNTIGIVSAVGRSSLRLTNAALRIQ